MKPLVTLFSAPKPFDREHIALIQRNAIRSWLALAPEVEVLLLGDEPGLAEVAAEMGVQHWPEVERNDHGTPLVASLFAIARRLGQAPYLCYVNGDIILMRDFVRAVAAVVAQATKPFLMVGRRWDVDITTPLDFSPGWEARLRAFVQQHGRRHSPFGIDYFVFPRQAYTDMPPLAVGRAGWDNWMIYHARQQGWQVVDASADVLAIHQNHDYAHLGTARSVYRAEESLTNVALAGGRSHMFSLWEANYRLADGRLRRLHHPHTTMLRRLELGLQRHGYPQDRWRRRLLTMVQSLLRRMF